MADKLIKNFEFTNEHLMYLLDTTITLWIGAMLFMGNYWITGLFAAWNLVEWWYVSRKTVKLSSIKRSHCQDIAGVRGAFGALAIFFCPPMGWLWTLMAILTFVFAGMVIKELQNK